MEILNTLVDLVNNLGTLGRLLAVLAWHWVLLIVWVAWWLWAVNWKKAWAYLAQGAWAPLVLLMVIAALVWSRIAPGECPCLSAITIPNFWWQLLGVSLFVGLALFCGWIQILMNWVPPEISLEPPVHGTGHGHGHHQQGGHEHGQESFVPSANGPHSH